MHAKWGFLVHTDDLEGIDASNFENFWVDYYDIDFSDGDNWFLPMVIVNDDDTVIPICEEGAYRGTDCLWNRFMGMPFGTRFEAALKYIAGCIAIDFDVPQAVVEGYSINRTVSEIMQDVNRIIPSRLEALLEVERGTVPPRPERDRDGNNRAYLDWYTRYDNYSIERFLKMYAHLTYAREYDNAFRMFGYRDNIRSMYRGMALNDAGYFPREHEAYRPLSIVILDYHY